MTVYLKEYEGLLCRYFDPTKELIDEEYHLVAKYLLRAYLRQVRMIHGEEGRSKYVEPTAEVTLSEVLSWYYYNCLPRLEEELKKWNEKALKELSLNLGRLDRLELLKDIPAIMSADTATIEGVLEVIMYDTSLSGIKTRIYSSIFKLLAYTVYYVVTFFTRRRLNGALQKIVSQIEKYRKLEHVIEKPGEVFKVIAEYLENPEVQVYISKEPMITERYVYELALKLKEIRTRLYGHR